MSANPQQIIPAQPAPVSTASAATLLQVIERAASNPAADIDKMERLMQMHERLVARESEAAFNQAMTACQMEIRRVAADADNPQTKSKYATYAKLDRVLRPVYTGHGLSLSFDTADSTKADHVRVLAYVSGHGHTRTYQVDMPADGKGAKGGDVMTKTHATGAAMSYGMRYLLKGIFNVAIGAEDTDGNDPPGGMPADVLDEWVKKIEAATTKERAKELWIAAIKVAKQHNDVGASKALKDTLIAQAEFIDRAAK